VVDAGHTSRIWLVSGRNEAFSLDYRLLRKQFEDLLLFHAYLLLVECTA
jgi:hypothetical protein